MQSSNLSENQATADGALVLFSGGQDSTTCVAWALERFARVETIAFDYGQRNRVELECRSELRVRLRSMRPNWAERLGADYEFDLRSLGSVSDTALTRDIDIGLDDDGLSNTFVPGRNVVFLSFAAAVAYNRDLRNIVIGVSSATPPAFPDCKGETIEALQAALSLGLDRDFRFHTPILRLEKAAVWRLALDLGGEPLVNLIVENTHTCFIGERGVRHAWGYGCGNCPACQVRAQGFEHFEQAGLSHAAAG